MGTEKSDKCWYTRRDGVMRGPFTAENVSRYILLGRIHLDDEVSQDRETWIVAGHLDNLLPDELKSQSCWDDYQKLVTAHMQADERKSDRRNGKRRNYLDRNAEKRVLGDRRNHVDNTLLCQHLLDNPVSSDEKRPVPQYKRPALLFVVLLVTMMFAWLSPTQS